MRIPVRTLIEGIFLTACLVAGSLAYQVQLQWWTSVSSPGDDTLVLSHMQLCHHNNETAITLQRQ